MCAIASGPRSNWNEYVLQGNVHLRVIRDATHVRQQAIGAHLFGPAFQIAIAQRQRRDGIAAGRFRRM
jgi:hypothetical protein